MKTRILMSSLGVMIGGISVGMFRTAALGIDPFQSLMSGLNSLIPISFGTLYVIANMALLLFSLIIDRHKIPNPDSQSASACRGGHRHVLWLSAVL